MFTHRTIGAATALFACLSTFAFAGRETCPPLNASFNVDFLSKYVWRGINYNNNGVMQSTLTLSSGGFEAFLFGNMDLTDSVKGYADIDHPAGQFTEYDLGVSYSGECKNISWTVGALNYVYPRQGFPQTTELYASVELPGPLKPTLTAYHDVEAVHGWYGTLCVSHTFDGVIKHKNGGYPLELCATLGAGDSLHNSFYYMRNGPEFTDLLLSASCPIPAGKNLTITPSLRYSHVMSEAILPGAVRRDNMVLGLSFNYAF